MKNSRNEKMSEHLLNVDEEILANAYEIDDAEKVRQYIKTKNAKATKPFYMTPAFRRVAAIAACFVLIVGVMFSIHTLFNPVNEAFAFDPQRYTIVGNPYSSNRFIPQSIQDLEKLVRFDYFGKPITNGAIILCTISGDSINRILEPPASEWEPDVVYGSNHVLTPVKIERVLYSGVDTSLEEGKEYYLFEDYFYITEETPDYYTKDRDNCIYTYDYYPMIKGNTYLVYIKQESDDLYNYQGETTLSPVSQREAFYCLGDIEHAKSVCITEDENYWKLWNEAKLLYEDIFASAK